MVKAIIPSKYKFPLWFLLKSPQRKLGYQTLWQDMKGIALFCVMRFWPWMPMQPISICVGLKNRSPLFLDKFVDSLAKCKNQKLIELSVFDCGSDDIEDLEAKIRERFSGKLVFRQEEMPFSRAASFNKAVIQSHNELIFICDADFSIPKQIVSMVNRYTLFHAVWFPIVFYLFKNKPEVFGKENGEWMQWGGKGILACQKSDFLKVGMLDERFVEWGGEDEELWLRFYRNGYAIIRNREKQLLHHWHPSHNPKYKKLAELAELESIQ